MATGELTAERESAAPGPWADTAAELGALLTAALLRYGIRRSAPVEVGVLGARDELAPTAPGERRVGRPLVHLYGHHALVGPFPEPGDGGGGCPRCLARRWQAVRASSLRDGLETGGQTGAAGSPPWALPFLADTVAALIAAATGAEGAVPERGRYASVHRLDLQRLTVEHFPLIPDTDCPDCGADGSDGRVDDSPTEAVIELVEVPKPAPDVFRQRSIGAYGLPVRALANPLTGMLGAGVAPDLCSVSTSATLGCLTVRAADYLDECFWGGHTGSYGSSVSVGLLEGLERFAGMRPRRKRTVVQARYADIAEQALDPRVCGVYPDGFHTPEEGVHPFSPDREIPWVWGYSMRDRRPVLVPEVVAYYHSPGRPEDRFVQESSSGCASGGCLEEAVYFGLMEVIERDAFLIAWYAKAELPEIDPYSSTRTDTRAMVDRLALYGYRARFFDTRITFPIPIVTAVAERIDGGLGALSFGAGASLDPESALSSGLCEIATDSVKLRRMAAQDRERLQPMVADRELVLGLHDHPLLYGLPEMADRADFLLSRKDEPRSLAETFQDDCIQPGPDLAEDVRRCVDAIAAAGFDVVVVDQSTSEQRELGFSTVKVLVPGLVPIDFGWRRQRALHLPRVRTALRDAGRSERVLQAEDLNPAPHPFP
jgi:ribosomal protein S12 methylthiotransferase accessory factor